MKITGNRALITDLYELTMAAAYFENNLDTEVVFELFIRSLPPDRGYAVLAGTETALEFMEELHFEPDEISYLRSLDVFKNVSDAFFDRLADFRFECDAWAMPEGTVFFPNEPVLKVSGPIIQAQILETFVLSAVNVETMVATKAARVNRAARGRPVADFGSRRAHGPEASVRAARAAYLGGCASTSNIYAGYKLGIPVTGTAAHSYTMLHDTELEAFRNYYKVFPNHTILLIDTYDTLEGARNAIRTGKGIRGVRLDSGDIAGLSKEVRRMLDEAGMENVKIVASGDLDEYEIDRLLGEGAPLDLFGVGTRMVTSADSPYMHVVYKLVDVIKGDKRIHRMKFSEDKVTYPGAKQVWRLTDGNGRFSRDILTMEDENPGKGEPLLEKVFEKGKRIGPRYSLEEARNRAMDQTGRLPEPYKSIRNPDNYPVDLSGEIKNALRQLGKKHF